VKVILESRGLRPVMRGAEAFGLARVAAIGPWDFYLTGTRRRGDKRLREGYYWGTLPRDARVIRENDDTGNRTVWFLLPGDEGY